MAYEILTGEVKEIYTITVKYDFLDEPTVIQIFNPPNGDNGEYIVKSIENREISERNNLEIIE